MHGIAITALPLNQLITKQLITKPKLLPLRNSLSKSTNIDLFKKLIIYVSRHKILNITDGIENIGGMQWELFGCLVLSWVVIYFIIRKGLHQSGKVNT